MPIPPSNHSELCILHGAVTNSVLVVPGDEPTHHPASGSGSAPAIVFFCPPSLQSLCIVVVLLWVTGRFCSQQTPEPPCDQGFQDWALVHVRNPPVVQEIMQSLLIYGKGMVWNSYWYIWTQTAQGCAASLPTQGAFLRIFGELQGVLCFISGDFMCVSGMSSLHKKIRHYPQKHDKPIQSYEKFIKSMCFSGKSLLVVIGTGTGVMQKVERERIYLQTLLSCWHWKL